MEELGLESVEKLGPTAAIAIVSLWLGYKLVTMFYNTQQEQLKSFLELQNKQAAILEKQSKSVDDLQKLITTQTDEVTKRIDNAEANIKAHVSKHYRKAKRIESEE
jgi:23S rRNA maturation mini-RNase III